MALKKIFLSYAHQDVPRPVYYQRTPFGRLQTLPTNGQPIVASNWKSLDEALLDVAEGIRKAA